VIDHRKAFEAVTADSYYLGNLDWGEARTGHPEGTVRAHIAEIEPNLETLRSKLTDEDYWKLKLLIHTHGFVRLRERSNLRSRRRTLFGDGTAADFRILRYH
jgi:hypothetical protein